MPQIHTSAVVGAPVSDVWALLRDFGAIGDWHPVLPPCRIEDGPADRVGCTPVFPMAGNHREYLVSLDDYGRTIAFSFADGCWRPRCPQLPLHDDGPPVTTGDQTYVEWCSRFDCDAPDEDKVISQISDGVLVPGLKALEHRFGPTT